MWMKSTWSRYSVLDLGGHVHHRATDAALTQQRGREQQHDRLLAEHVGEVDLVHVVVRIARVDLRQVAGNVQPGRRVDRRRGLADSGHGIVLLRDHDELRRRRGGGYQAVVQPRHAEHLVLAGLLERHVGDVQGLGRVGVGVGRLAQERGLDRERLVVRHERALGLAAANRGDVDGGACVGDLRPRRREQAEAEAILPGHEHRARGGQHRSALGQVAAQLGQRAAGGARELIGAGLGRRLGGVVPVVAASAAARYQRAGEESGSKCASAAHGGGEG